MTDETLQLIAASVVILAELYAAYGRDFPVLAWFWDIIARVAGQIAYVFGRIGLQARVNYYRMVQE